VQPSLRLVDPIVPTPAPQWLADVALEIAKASETWISRVRHDPGRRFYEQLVETDEYDVWVIGWAPGQAIAAHDHGESAGAIVVTEGALVETRWSAVDGDHADAQAGFRFVRPGDEPAVFTSDDVHAIANLHDRPATSVHVYSPPLSSMGWFDSDDDELRVTRVGEVDRAGSHGVTIDGLLSAARSGLRRPLPVEARLAAAKGGLLVDIRPEATRRTEGSIPGSLVIERNELEWRLDPTSPDRIPEAIDHEVEVILVCNEGYASSLAAASLQELGLVNATDLDGGFRAWKQAGLPVVESMG
jgi:rhodanese-related sulfurtransferase